VEGLREGLCMVRVSVGVLGEFLEVYLGIQIRFLLA